VTTISGSLVVNGSSVTFPNQSLTDPSSVLTQGLADSRYLRPGAANWSVGSGATANGTGSIAFGNGANSVGDSVEESISIGSGATAYTSTAHTGGIAIGYQAKAGTAASSGGGVAIGQQASTNYGGIAIGYEASTGSYYENAIGTLCHAGGGQSTALGFGDTANAYSSTALGVYLQTYGCAETVVGLANAAEPGASLTTIVSTANCFVVGNGNLTGTRSNAFTIQWNGDATMYGNAHVTKTLTTDQGANITGNVQVTGDIQISGTATVQPKGGISMGAYTAP
jgi:hypothetical protein